jgi:hypothetical protein
MKTIGQLIADMLVPSDNAATRTLILAVGPGAPTFAGINATAATLGMASTNMNIYPGCGITNQMTQVDAALLYEQIWNGTALSTASRDALFQLMPAATYIDMFGNDIGDFTGSLGDTLAIADAEAAALGVPVSVRDEFKSEIMLHYKAGGDAVTLGGVSSSHYSISGLAEIPTCSGPTRTITPYLWGLFIDGASNDYAASTTFLTANAEPLRRPVNEALADWRSCYCNEATYEAESMFQSTGGPIAGGWNIWANGFISTTHDFSAGGASIVVRAQGQAAQGVDPHMIVSVNGTPIADTFVSSGGFNDYAFNFVTSGGPQEIVVQFDNDFFNPPFEDRNLLVDNVRVTCFDETATPCASLCAPAEPFAWTGSYQGGALGTGAICRETTQTVVDGNCGNFAAGRQLFLNGVEMPCNVGNWGASTVPPPLNGGYCVQTTPGDFPWAFVTLW